MDIDRRVYCGVEALTRLALRDSQRPCTAAEIAAWIDESPRFVESVMASLGAAGLVARMEAPLPGYRLACPPTAISVADIFEAAEELDADLSFTGPTVAGTSSRAGADLLWRAIRACPVSFLSDMSLADLLEDEAGPALGETEQLLSGPVRSRVLH